MVVFVIAPLIMFGVIITVRYIGGITLEPIAMITFIVQSAGPVIAVLPIVANESGADLPFATGLVMISTILFVFRNTTHYGTINNSWNCSIMDGLILRYIQCKRLAV